MALSQNNLKNIWIYRWLTNFFEKYKLNIHTYLLKAYSYFLCPCVCRGPLWYPSCENRGPLCGCSRARPKFVSAQTVCVERVPTAHTLGYNLLLHTPVQLLQLQHWLFKSFLWFFFRHRFTQFDACQSLMSNIFRSGVYSVEASQQVKLFHMGEQSNVSTWLVLS